MSRIQRKTVSALIAIMIFVVLTPNLVPIVQQAWQTYVLPPTFVYDQKVSIPQSSGLVEGDMEGYQGLQKYELPGLSQIYRLVDSVQSPQSAVLSIRLERDSVTVGDNVTFVVVITFAKPEDRQQLGLCVFLSDPRGIVRGAFPDGKIPGQSVGSPMYSASYPYLSYIMTMQEGRLAFTFRIPQDSLSVGDWTIFVLGTDYSPNFPIGPFIAWNAVTFKVTEPPRVEQTIGPTLELVRSLGIFFAAYGFVNKYFESLAAGAKTLRENWALLLGLLLIVSYVALAFLFQR